MSINLDCSTPNFAPTVLAMYKVDPSMLQTSYRKQAKEFVELIKIAKDKEIDIRKQIHKMQQVLNDRFSDQSMHQLQNVRTLYEIKMYKQYNKEISRKIAKHNLFYENKFVLHSELQTQIYDIDLAFQKWIKRAYDYQIDIQEQITKREQVKECRPSVNESHQFLSIGELYEIKMSNLLCNQIIRKVVQFEIQQRSNSAKTNLRLNKYIPQIEQNEKYLISLLPAKDLLQSIEKTEREFDFLMQELEKIEAYFVSKL